VNQHPVDRLIRELIASGRMPDSEELTQIANRMATAPFDTRVIPVPVRMQGLVYQNQVLGTRADSLRYHVIKRVLDERQWANGTTPVQYVADLRRAVRNPLSRLGIYARRGGAIAVSLGSTEFAVPLSRRTRESLPNLLVVYSADRGTIISGYQASGLEQTGIPEDARWLT
jgi:hypothetical protein